jgi:hypothetical protein
VCFIRLILAENLAAYFRAYMDAPGLPSAQFVMS